MDILSQKPAQIFWISFPVIIVTIFFITFDAIKIARKIKLKQDGIVTEGLLINSERELQPWGLYKYIIHYKYSVDMTSTKLTDNIKKKVNYIESSSEVTKNEFEKYELLPNFLVTFDKENPEISVIGDLKSKSYLGLLSAHKANIFLEILGILVFIMSIIARYSTKLPGKRSP